MLYKYIFNIFSANLLTLKSYEYDFIPEILFLLS